MVIEAFLFLEIPWRSFSAFDVTYVTFYIVSSSLQGSSKFCGFKQSRLSVLQMLSVPEVSSRLFLLSVWWVGSLS